MQAYLACVNPACRAEFSTDDVILECAKCSGLLEVAYSEDLSKSAASVKQQWRERRMNNEPLDQSGVWRYREMLPFDGHTSSAITLREGNTPVLNCPKAAQYAGIDQVLFKHQGFNPTGSFKDNGMTCGITQAVRLGRTRVACVSTGNTSASMAAYASAAGLKAFIFLPQGNISFGKLAQALEYGAITVQIEANFDEILALVRQVADRCGLYLLNSLNPFRIEGQKTIAIELLDQLDWKVPDWLVLPGGNLGNTSAFGKGFLELYRAGMIDTLPRIAVIQASGAAPFYQYIRSAGRSPFEPVQQPKTLATAIKIGDPVSWGKAQAVIEELEGIVEIATEQEIADAKAIIGQAGIGCEPASAASLAGIKKLADQGIIKQGEFVVGVLTGNVMKDTDYILAYHTGKLISPDGNNIGASFANRPISMSNDLTTLAHMLNSI